MKPFFVWCGGRKMFIAMGGCVLLIAGALFTVWLGEPFPFGRWGQLIVALLLGVKMTAAYEDGQKHRALPGHWNGTPPPTPDEPQIPED